MSRHFTPWFLSVAVALTLATNLEAQCSRFELETLKPSQSTRGDSFGWRLDMDGDLLAIAAPGGTNGSVVVFRKQGNRWVEEARLYSSASNIEVCFGCNVAVGGDLLVAAIQGPLTGGSYQTIVEVFRHNGTGWNFEQRFTPAGASFQSAEPSLSVRDDGNAFAVGSDATGSGQGSIHYYEFDGAAWNQMQVLKPSQGSALGGDVLVTDDVLLASTNDKQQGAQNFMFEFRPDTNGLWVENQILVAQSYQNPANFSVDGTSLLVAMPEHQGAPASVHEFRDDGSAFQYVGKLQNPPGGSIGAVKVDHQDGVAVITDPSTSTASVYRQDGTGWRYHTRFLPRDYQPLDDVALDNGEVIWGGPTLGNAAGEAGRYRVDLTLDAQPPTVAPSSTLTLTTGPGTPGSSAVMVVVKVNGTPTFVPVRFGTLDACGDWTESYLVAPGLTGTSLRLQSFGQDWDGTLQASPTTRVRFL